MIPPSLVHHKTVCCGTSFPLLLVMIGTLKMTIVTCVTIARNIELLYLAPDVVCLPFAINKLLLKLTT